MKHKRSALVFPAPVFALALAMALPIGSVRGDLPSPVDLSPPPEGIESPGGTSLPAFSKAAPEGSPQIGAISETTFPDETLVITGHDLDGANLKVWSEDGIFDVPALRTTNNRMQAVVPAKLPDGKPLRPSTMLVWPVKGDLVGIPIRVNGATAWWAWPARADALTANQTVRVFGRNLVLPEGPEPVMMLIRPDGRTTKLEISDANAYQVAAALPEDLETGIHQLQAHNGTGGVFGWSDPVSLEVVAATSLPPEIFEVESFREKRDSDRVVVEKAIQAAVANGGGTVRFAARTYNGLGDQGNYAMRRTPDDDALRGERTRPPIILPEGVPLVLQGAGMGEKVLDEQSWWGHEIASNDATIISDNRSQLGETIFVLKGEGQRIEDMTIQVNGLERISGIRLFGRNQTVQRVRLIREHGPYPVENTLIEAHAQGQNTQTQILNCELLPVYRAITITSNTNYVRIADCAVFGHHDRGRYSLVNAVTNLGGHQMILEDSTFEAIDKTHGKTLGRTYLAALDPLGYNYIAGNKTIWFGSHTSVPGMGGNGSEQYLMHVGQIDGGIYQVVSATADGLELDAAANNLPEDLGLSTRGDWAVFVCKGKGVGQWRLIQPGSRGASLKVDRPWRIKPDESSQVNVQRVFHRNIIFDNYMDASPDPSKIEPHHKTVGVYWYHNCIDNITAANTMKNVGTGVALSSDNRTFVSWTLIRDNHLENMAGSAGGTSVVPVFYNEVHRGDGWTAPREDFSHWINLGNIFRSNTGKGAEALVQVGWLRFNEIKEPQSIVYEPDSEKGFVMGIVENNSLLDGKRGVLLSAPSTWTLFRNNTLSVVEGADLWEIFLSPLVTGLLVLEGDKEIQIQPLTEY